MLKARIHSDGADIISSGVAFSYLGKSIVIEVLGLYVVFKNIKNNEKETGIFSVAKPEENTFTFELLNLKTKPYTVGPQNIGDAVAIDEKKDESHPKTLDIFFTVTPFKIAGQDSFKIEYSIFAVDL